MYFSCIIKTYKKIYATQILSRNSTLWKVILSAYGCKKKVAKQSTFDKVLLKESSVVLLFIYIACLLSLDWCGTWVTHKVASGCWLILITVSLETDLYCLHQSVSPISAFTDGFFSLSQLADSLNRKMFTFVPIIKCFSSFASTELSCRVLFSWYSWQFYPELFCQLFPIVGLRHDEGGPGSW